MQDDDKPLRGDAEQAPGLTGQQECRPAEAGGRQLSPAALRALAEAEARRRERAATEAANAVAPKEINGREGPDPVRYGDWEVKGIVSDF